MIKATSINQGKIKQIRLNENLIPVSDVCYSHMLHVYGYVFCSIPLLFASIVHAYAFKSKVHCGSALGPAAGDSGLPYFCAPPVLVPTVLGGLAVWRHNKPKTKNQHWTKRIVSTRLTT